MRTMSVLAIAAMLYGARPVPDPAVPVVVELFTSEGCSSCPPADAVLSRLAKEQPVAGAEVIPLGMHVTYWDRQGWKDAASLPLATERQEGYGRIFGGDRVYTPQAVIDGHQDVVGSDEASLKAAIARAAKEPHARLSMKWSVDGDALAVDLTVADIPVGVKEPLEAWFALTEDDLTSIVKRGENGGRTLHHDAAVRGLFGASVNTALRPVSYRTTLKPAWRRDRLHLNALLQGKTSRRIYGASTGALK
jgi:hypothetical protein